MLVKYNEGTRETQQTLFAKPFQVFTIARWTDRRPTVNDVELSSVMQQQLTPECSSS